MQILKTLILGVSIEKYDYVAIIKTPKTLDCINYFYKLIFLLIYWVSIFETVIDTLPIRL